MGIEDLNNNLPANEPEFFQRLYAQYWPDLKSYILRTFGRGPPDPEDVAQAVFTQLYAKNQLAHIENHRAYLYASARNFVVSYYRRHMNTQGSHAEVTDEQHVDEKYISHISPERVYLMKERLANLAKTIAKMPKKREEILLLNRIHGLSCQEIGEKLGMSRSAVQKHIDRALVDCYKHKESGD